MEAMNANQKKNFRFVVFFLTCLVHSTHSQGLDYPDTITNTSMIWKISLSPVVVQVTPILHSGRFICGFYCNFDGTGCLFAVLLNEPYSRSLGIESPQLVWSANRDNPVKAGATLLLTGDGGLVVGDVDGAPVWSTNTSSKSVPGITLTALGNLKLFDENNYTIWESVDHPTDTLFEGQTLYSGMELTASTSTSNWSEGMFGLAIKGSQLIGYVDANPPQSYFIMDPGVFSPYFAFTMVAKGMKAPRDSVYGLEILTGSLVRFMKLGPDGHFRLYELKGSDWGEAADLLTSYTGGECGYPMVCGKYGVCSMGGCGCPEAASDGTVYFKPLNGQPKLGCKLVTPISCEHSEDHILLEVKNTNYFFFQPNMENVDVENCKLACLRNCSCKAFGRIVAWFSLLSFSLCIVT